MAEVGGNNPEGEVRELEGAQMPHELNPLYSWATRDVLGIPSTLTEDYLKSLKEFGVICGGGEEEEHYRVELPRRGERICELNLEHPRVPHWLWVNEVMFTEFGVRIPFTSFQQRLLQRCFVAPSQFHPNAWSSIRCFELVTKYLELPQDPKVFLYLFTVFSPNAEGDHPPFWLTLERDASRFPSYWSKDAGLNYVPVSYKKLNEDQRDTADILLWLFSKRFLKPKAVLGNPERAREAILEMAGGKKTLALLRQAMQANPQGPVIPNPMSGQASSSNPEGGGGSSNTTSARKRPRTSDGSKRDLCPIDRSFDASGFIESNFMGPRALEALQDYDPMESTRWVQWVMLHSATILKSVEPRLTLADHWERRCTQLTGEMKLLDLRPSELEEGKAEAEAAKSQAEKDLEAALKAGKEKDVEVQRLRDREVSLLAELESVKKRALGEKARADKAEASFTAAEAGRQEVLKLAEDAVKETEAALKEQILVLAPNFDVSRLGAFKEVVDGQIVDPPPGGEDPSCRALSGSDPQLITLNDFSKESVVPCLTGSDWF
ncbi:hypothetical protein PIB30_036312 [Stylosanthes scabra]|uniref:Transposase (Putative), gypsy type n=1 Tax=Stylosanthes scabra TaxID=79078 RepID=A0ABU6SE76_9FABA|nr:hypothetical protein [Stylosanthes scabra]